MPHSFFIIKDLQFLARGFVLGIILTIFLFLFSTNTFAASINPGDVTQVTISKNYYDPTLNPIPYDIQNAEDCPVACNVTGLCANSQNADNCGLPACEGGNSWHKYNLQACKVKSFNEATGRLVCEAVYSQADVLCSIGDKCVGGEIGLRAGKCDCTFSPNVYKYCCTPAGNPETCNNNAIQDTSYPDEGQCPGGYIVEGYRVRSSDCVPIITATPAPTAAPTPVPGDWSNWSTCSATECGTTGTQTRTCTNPAPANGGAYCSGPDTQTCYASACFVCSPINSYPQCGGTCNGYDYPANHTVSVSVNSCSDGTTQYNSYSCLDLGPIEGQCGNETTTPPDKTYCGDGTCDADESCSTCTADCGQCQPDQGPTCGYGACGGDGCASGSRLVSGTNCPPEWYEGAGCYSDDNCQLCPNGNCGGPVSCDLADYGSYLYASNDGTNWSREVSTKAGDRVYFKMEVTALKNNPYDLYIRNKFDDILSGFTNIWHNTDAANGNYQGFPYNPSCWGWPGLCPDFHRDDGYGTGIRETGIWSVVLSPNAQTFKNQAFAAVSWHTGGCVNKAAGAYSCWQDPESGGPTCVSYPIGCGTTWFDCPYNMTFQTNQVTVRTTATIAGYVKNSQTNAPIQGVKVNVNNAANETRQATTNASGYWEVLDLIRPGQNYAVRIPAQTAQIISNYIVPAKTAALGGKTYTINNKTYINWTYDYVPSYNTDTLMGDLSYEGQLAGTNDCAGPDDTGRTGRCNFTLNPVSNPKGNLDTVDATCTAKGWACDGDNYNQAIPVILYANRGTADERLLDSVMANKQRPDLPINGNPCGGTTNHGFEFPIPTFLKTGSSQTLTAIGSNIASGTNTELTNSPLTFNCTQAAPTAPPQPNLPWIQTTGGDVHSNIKINTPGGP